MNKSSISVKRKKSFFKTALSQWQLFAMLLPAFALILVFHYVPMYGITIAFKNLKIGDSLFGGEWVGFQQFQKLFASPKFPIILRNTLAITLTSTLFTWPLPIIFALLVHNCSSNSVRKISQTFSYMPHLLATVIIVTLIEFFCNQETGLINIVLKQLGLGTYDFLGSPKAFLPIYIISGVWQGLGSSAVIYIAALTAVDTQLIEAATIDGANKIQRMWYVDVPTIMPTFVLLQVMNIGKILNVGYEKVLLLQNDLNISTSEIISTYVYKRGLISTDYSYSAAISLFNNVVGLILVLVSNRIAKKLSDISLF